MSLGLIIGSAVGSGLLNLLSDNSQVNAQNKRVNRAQSFTRKGLIDSSKRRALIANQSRFFNASAASAANSAAGQGRNLINPGVAIGQAISPIFAQQASSASQLDYGITENNNSIYNQLGQLELGKGEADPYGSFFSGGVRGGIVGAQMSSVLSELGDPGVEPMRPDTFPGEYNNMPDIGINEGSNGARTMGQNIANAQAIQRAFTEKTNIPNTNTYDINPNVSNSGYEDDGVNYPTALEAGDEGYEEALREWDAAHGGKEKLDMIQAHTSYRSPEMVQLYMNANDIKPMATYNSDFNKMAGMSRNTPMPINPAEDPNIVDKELTETMTNLFGRDIPLEILGALTGGAAIKYLGKGVANAGRLFKYSPDVASKIPKFTNTVKQGLGSLLKEGQHVEATLDMIRQAEKAQNAIKFRPLLEVGAQALTSKQKTAQGFMKLLNEAKDQREVEMTLNMIKQFLGK